MKLAMYPENKENLPELSPAYLEEVYFFQYYDGPLHGFCIFDEEIYFYDVFEEPFHGCDSSCIFYEKCELDHKKFVEFYRKEYNKPDYDSQFKDDMCASMDRFYVLIDLDEEQVDKARRYMENHIQNFGYSNVYTVYFQKRKKFIEENKNKHFERKPFDEKFDIEQLRKGKRMGWFRWNAKLNRDWGS